MKKFLFSLILFSTNNTFAFNLVNISSNQFNAVNVSSADTSIVPSTTTLDMNDKITQIIFSNMSSSVTVFFSTSPDAAWTRDNGFPLISLQNLSFDYDMAFPYSSSTLTRFYFTRDSGGAGGPNISIRSWVRYAR